MEYLILNLFIRIKLISKTVLHSDSRDMLPVRIIVRFNLFYYLAGRPSAVGRTEIFNRTIEPKQIGYRMNQTFEI